MNAQEEYDRLGELPTTTDLLRQLCERQMTLLAEKNVLLTELQQAKEKLGGELLEASEARKQALLSLLDGVQKAKVMTDAVVKQRDVVLTALRSLCAHLSNQPITSLTYFGGEAFMKTVREATELLKVVDQLHAAAAARPPS